MADTQVTIDPATVFDNIDDRQVDFSGTAGEDRYDLAVQYDVLEALSGENPAQNAVALFQRHTAEIEKAAGRALARFSGIGRTIVSGNDLEQPAGAALGE